MLYALTLSRGHLFSLVARSSTQQLATAQALQAAKQLKLDALEMIQRAIRAWPLASASLVVHAISDSVTVHGVPRLLLLPSQIVPPFGTAARKECTRNTARQ